MTGYMIGFLAQIAGSIPTVSVCIQFITLLLGFCYFFYFIAADLTNDMAEVNAAVQSSKRNYAELLKSFCNIVRLYSDTKQ